MIKKKIIFSIMVFLVITVWAQDKKLTVNFATPNAANLGVYGDIPVNHFTGMPNINIPVYTINENEIKIPLNLSYHLGSIKPDNHPGWTGLGWSLSTGGAITRVVKGLADEIADYNLVHKLGYYFNHQRLNISNWNNKSNIKEFTERTIFSPQYEVQADEFHFNFLGYSGTFYLNHKGEWVVKSDHNLRIVFEPDNGGFVRFNDLSYRITSKWDMDQDYFFNEFTIITEDGTRYKFGGVSATEYSTIFRRPGIVTPTTWYLSKITTPKGNIIEYEYEEGNLIVSLGRNYYYKKYKGGNLGCDGYIESLGFNLADGYLHFPVYLKKIKTNNSTVEFLRSVTTEINYDDDDIEIHPGADPINFFRYHDSYQDFKWEQLDEIRVYNSNNNLHKNYVFNYTNSTDTRLKLLSFEEKFGDSPSGLKYTFKYNPNNLPIYCSTAIDHWGFFNGFDGSIFRSSASVNEKITEYYNKRNPNISGEFYKHEVLEKIIYPTNGYTTFEYEPHTYRSTVNQEREKPLIEYDENRFAGGLRIKKITSVADNDSSQIVKDFFYVKGYNAQNTTNLPSSGILNGLPKYTWLDYTAVDLEGNPYTYDLFSSYSLTTSLFNSRGVHVGYSEVIEKTNGNGYRKYTFTNYDTDIHGNHHRDEAPIEIIEPERSIYSPYTSKSIERGKVTSITNFTESGTKTSEDIFFYEESSDEFLRSVYTDHQNVCSGGNVGAQNFYGSAYKTYLYDYNLIKKENRVYDINGSNPITTITEYDFNSKNLISQENIRTSDGKTLSKKIYYPDDFINSTTLQNSIQLKGGELSSYSKVVKLKSDEQHQIAVPIQTETYINEELLSINRTEFLENIVGQESLVLPKTTLFSKSENLKSRFEYSVYDDHGNIQEMSKTEGIKTVYLWGYKNQLPIAKIENAEFNTVKSILGSTTIRDFGDDPNPTNEEISNFLLPLRSHQNLKNAMITSYTYNPLIGITSITDPKGQITYYNYDEYGRLKQVKDNDRKILSDTYYHYKN